MDTTPNTPETGTPVTPSSKTPQILGAIGALIVVGAAGVFAINHGKAADGTSTPTPSTDNDGGSDEAQAPTPGSNPDVGMTNPAANDNDGDVDATSSMSDMPGMTDQGSTPSTTSYKDGTYSAEGDYNTHVGPESIKIGITLKGGIITDTTFQGTPNAAMSQKFMDMFSSNYKAMVVGKNIDDVKLGKVSGSSLTPMGFNDALTKIKAEASS